MSTAAAGQKPVRKFPPPCWTRDEALVLIEAYRERWYAVHRAFLRTTDWDAVSEKVTTSCPDVTPPKTSAQCRHKMEKLRQRHRAEKQRAAAFSGERFFSSWFYFEAMEAMENGSSSEPGSIHPINSEIKNPKSTPTPSPQGLNPGRGIRFKPSAVQNLVTLASSSTKHSVKSKSIPNFGSNQEDDDEDEYLVETPIEETLIPTAKNHKNSSIGSGRLALKSRKFRKVVNDDEDDENGEMWIRVPRNTNLFRGKHQNGNNSNPNGKNSKKKKKKMNGIGGLSEVVSSIRILGDGIMKMEQMKMDMAKEIEKMRMETEMSRNRLILESQKQIVDAFVKGFMESRKQPATMAHV